MYYARFKGTDDSFTMFLPIREEKHIKVDNSFLSDAIMNHSKSLKTGHLYDVTTEDATSKFYTVTPIIPYELYEKTDNPQECDYVAIDYFAGRDFKKVLPSEKNDGTTFLVDEKLKVMYRPDLSTMDEINGYQNDVLHYRGLETVEKAEEDRKYDTDTATLIELLPECRYQMFKSIGMREPI